MEFLGYPFSFYQHDPFEHQARRSLEALFTAEYDRAADI